ncbi:MAG: glycerophosphodiester phosphodiesterase family protein [Bacteroidales bacterium]|nr:glycerophosphodiester phosphodiesterase family protein [Bacteroidales bacterium]
MRTLSLISLALLCAALLGMNACSNRAKQQVDDQKIEIVVHRGANHLAPENTLPSARAALEHGADWVELDVRMCKDSVFYNLHDDTLGRTTNGSGRIADWLSADLDTLDAGSWFGPSYVNTTFPTIEMMLDSLRGECGFFFDVKRGTAIPLFVELLHRKGIRPEESFYWFADSAMLREFMQLAPEMPIKVNASNVERVKEWQQVCKPAYIETEVPSLTPELLDYCHSHGIKVMGAIQEASDSLYTEAIRKKPDLVNIDKPELFSQIMAQGLSED